MWHSPYAMREECKVVVHLPQRFPSQMGRKYDRIAFLCDWIEEIDVRQAWAHMLRMAS